MTTVYVVFMGVHPDHEVVEAVYADRAMAEAAADEIEREHGNTAYVKAYEVVAVDAAADEREG